MEGMISRFMDQIEEAMQIGEEAQISLNKNDIDKIYVAGLGGSGIGGDFVRAFTYDSCPVPYIVGKSYTIPAYIDNKTLFIASSYSGNTEETLEALALAESKGAKILAVSSGGKIIDRAKEKSYDYIQIPDNWASPRACLGYSLVQQMYILNKLGLIDESFKNDLKKSVELLRSESVAIKEKADKIAQILFGKIPIIYAEDSYEPVATRFRQQINENGKMLCWHHVIPEMNHNELVGWRNHRAEWAVVMFRSSDNLLRNQLRMDINKNIISEYCDNFIEVHAKGSSLIERSMYLVHLGDWVSLNLANLGNRDSIEVKVIDYLKSELAKH